MPHTRKGQATREKLIEAAYGLAIRKGFDRTSIGEILETAGVKKGNFFHHFPDKESLGLAVLERDRAQMLGMIEGSLQESHPLKSIGRFFRLALQKHTAAGFVGGCLWGNTALEMSDSNPAFATYVADVFAAWTAKTESVIRAGQKSGEIRRDIPAASLARSVIAAVEGGIMQSRLSKKTTEMKSCLAAMLRMLAPANPSKPKQRKP